MPLLVSSINFGSLGIALWLGLYIVTRSQSRLAWLASSTLWALSAYFLNRVANLNFPDQNLLAPLCGTTCQPNSGLPRRGGASSSPWAMVWPLYAYSF